MALRILPKKYLLDDYMKSSLSFVGSFNKLKYNATSPCTLSFSIAIANMIVPFLNGYIDIDSVENYIKANNGGTLAGVSVYVQQMTDQSGNGNHVTQSTQANQPRVMNNGVWDVDINGKLMMVYNGTSSLLFNTTVSFTNLCSYFAVIQNTGSDATARRALSFGDSTLGTNQNNINFTPSSNSLGVGIRFPESQTIAYTQSLSNQSIISYSRFSTTSQQTWFNGVSKGTNINSTTTFTATRLSVGGVVGTQYWQGNISEIIIISTLSDAQRLKIERNQGKRYNIISA